MQIRHFNTPWWLGNGHLQTSWGSFFRPEVDVVAQKLSIPLRDQACLNADAMGPDIQAAAAEQPKQVCILMHGLSGSSASHYIRGIQKTIFEQEPSLLTLAINHRGSLGHACPAIETPILYHAGLVTDLQDICAFVAKKWPNASISMVGISLSGNMLVRALGLGCLPLLSKAMAISVPFELAMVSDQVDKGMGLLYRRYLINRMKKIVLQKQAHTPFLTQPDAIHQYNSFWAFDNFVIAPMHGFRNVHHYYREASSRQYVGAIEQPLLIVQALDDPLVPVKAWPSPKQIPKNVEFEAYDRGGHVGFISPQGYWLEQRILQWLVDKPMEP